MFNSKNLSDNVALLYRHFGNFSNNARLAHYGDVNLTLEFTEIKLADIGKK